MQRRAKLDLRRFLRATGHRGSRVAPMTGAVRISVGEIVLIDQDPWGLDATVGSAMGLSELVAAGLLRRPDVHFVEQRRFAAAAEAERRREHPPGAPRG